MDEDNTIMETIFNKNYYEEAKNKTGVNTEVSATIESRAGIDSSIVPGTVRASIFNHLPRELIWSPQENITTHELALCIPYIVGSKHIFSEYDSDTYEPFFRHFIFKHRKEHRKEQKEEQA